MTPSNAVFFQAEIATEKEEGCDDTGGCRILVVSTGSACLQGVGQQRCAEDIVRSAKGSFRCIDAVWQVYVGLNE